jgi:hypothetical protein
MTEYADVKVSPILRDLAKDIAEQQYGTEHRAISRMGHEALITWMIVRADDDIVQSVLQDGGFETIQDLIDALADADGADGRFSNDPQFAPMAAIETPRDLSDGQGDA